MERSTGTVKRERSVPDESGEKFRLLRKQASDKALSASETLEILDDPAAMTAIRAHRAGRGVYYDVAELDKL